MRGRCPRALTSSTWTKLRPMNLCRLVLCLSLLMSSLGSAQTADEEWNPYTPSSPAPSVPPPLVPAEPPAPPSAPAPASPQGEIIPREPDAEAPSKGMTAVRLVATPFSGIIGVFGGSMAGAIFGGVFMLPFCTDALRSPDQNPGCVVGFAAVSSLGATLGATATVYWTGRVLGGHGQFLPTLTGAALGTTMGAISGTVSSNTLVLLLGLGVGPILGAVLGYELSHAWTDASRPPRTGFAVLPVVGAAPGGGLLGGLSGRF